MSRVNEMIESADDLSRDDVNQLLKHLLIDTALRIFPRSSKIKTKKEQCFNH